MDCTASTSRPDLIVTTERLSAPFAADLLASAQAAARHRRPRAARARTKTHRRQPGHPAQSSSREAGQICPKTVRCWSTAPAATAPPSPPASSSAADFSVAKSPAASPHGKPPSYPLKAPKSETANLRMPAITLAGSSCAEHQSAQVSGLRHPGQKSRIQNSCLTSTGNPLPCGCGSIRYNIYGFV